VSRLKSSLIPGGVISLALLWFAILLFFVLFISQDKDTFTQIDSHIWSLLKFTLFQAFLSTLFSTMLGTLLALFWTKDFSGNFFLLIGASCFGCCVWFDNYLWAKWLDKFSLLVSV